MIRRFFLLWFPIVLIAAFSAVSYRFWRVETVGQDMIPLPAQSLSGHEIRVARAQNVDPSTSSCAWRVYLTVEALKDLGGIELAYSRHEESPSDDAWKPLPTSTTESAFVAILKPPPEPARRLHLRGKIGKTSIFWDLPEAKVTD